MNIRLNNIMPNPLSSIQHGEDSIWGNDIQLNQGEKIMLNASSGKGKTTFTHLMFGLRNDYNGELLLGTTRAIDLDPNAWTELRMKHLAVVFQDLQLFPRLTVKENLLLKNSLTNAFQEEELREMIERLGIADKWEQKCGLLSMGQQQRVAIVRGLSQPFDWLILDEPFSHLDKENTAKCMDLIHERTVKLNAGFILATLGETYGYNFDRELKL